MDKHPSRWRRTPPARLALAVAATILLAILIQSNIRLFRLQQENAMLLRSLPDLASADTLPCIVEAETINGSCKRYYVAVGPNQTVQAELETAVRNIDLGAIDGKDTGRIFQLWLGLIETEKEDYINIHIEELSSDGCTIIRPDLSAGFVTHATATFTIGRSAAKLAFGASNVAGDAANVALVYSGQDPFVWLRLQPPISATTVAPGGAQ